MIHRIQGGIHGRSPTTENLAETFERSLGFSFWLVEVAKLIGKVVVVFFILIAYTCLLTGILPLAVQPYIIPFALPLGIAIGAFYFFQPEKEEIFPPLPTLEKIALSEEEPRSLPEHPLATLAQVIRLEPIDWDGAPPPDPLGGQVWSAFSKIHDAYREVIAFNRGGLEDDLLMENLKRALSQSKDLPVAFEEQISLFYNSLQERDPGRISFEERVTLLREDGSQEEEASSCEAPYLSLCFPLRDRPYQLQECFEHSTPYQTDQGEICLRQTIHLKEPPPILRFHIDRRERDWRLSSSSKLRACSRCCRRSAPPPALLSYPPPQKGDQKNKVSIQFPPHFDLPLEGGTTAPYELLYIVEHRGDTLARGNYLHYEKRGGKIFKVEGEWSTPLQGGGLWPPLEAQPYFVAYRRVAAPQPRD